MDFRRAAMHCRRRRTAAATTMMPPPPMSSSPRRQFPDLPRLVLVLSCRGRRRMYEETCWISEEQRCTVDDGRPMMPPPPMSSSSSPWRRRRQFPDLPRPLTTDLQRGSYSSGGTAVLIKYVFFLSNFNTSASYQSARWEGSRLNSGSLFAR